MKEKKDQSAWLQIVEIVATHSLHFTWANERMNKRLCLYNFAFCRVAKRKTRFIYNKKKNLIGSRNHTTRPQRLSLLFWNQPQLLIISTDEIFFFAIFFLILYFMCIIWQILLQWLWLLARMHVYARTPQTDLNRIFRFASCRKFDYTAEILHWNVHILSPTNL